MKKLFTALIALLLTISLCACSAGYDGDAMIAQVQDYINGQAFVATISSNITHSTSHQAYYFAEDGTVTRRELLETRDEVKSDETDFSNCTFTAVSAEEVTIEISYEIPGDEYSVTIRDYLKVKFIEGQIDSIWVNYSDSYYLATEYTDPYLAGYPKPESNNSDDGFTNRYGQPDTVCAHSGCNNNIASSGDTNCCTTHSNRCGECGCYIDEDAMFCMDCLESALD